MFKISKQEVEIEGKKITLETGKIARQADGAVLVDMAGTMVLVTAVGQKEAASGRDFFPLTVTKNIAVIASVT